jgi:branched-chain amino acid transport system ATP-binding protein
LLTGVLPPTEGRIVLDGQDITDLSPHARVQRGMVRTFQINQLFDTLTPLQTLALTISRHRGLSARWWQKLGHDAAVMQRCEALLERFHLSEVMNQPTRVLPYGKRRLLEIVSTFISSPEVFLLDEPASGVNPALLVVLADFISAMYAERPRVFLVVEHNMEFIMSLAQDIIVMHQGRVLERGTPAQVQASPAVMEAYLG